MRDYLVDGEGEGMAHNVFKDARKMPELTGFGDIVPHGFFLDEALKESTSQW